jgi:hypothetical protein
MKNRWTVQTEKGDYTAGAVWAAVEKNASGKGNTTAVVLNTKSKAAVVVLTTGMFYLSGPEMSKPVLFRIQHSSRARLKDCMLVKAVEVADLERLKENSILNRMRELLELDMLEAEVQSMPFPGTVAS